MVYFYLIKTAIELILSKSEIYIYSNWSLKVSMSYLRILNIAKSCLSHYGFTARLTVTLRSIWSQRKNLTGFLSKGFSWSLFSFLWNHWQHILSDILLARSDCIFGDFYTTILLFPSARTYRCLPLLSRIKSLFLLFYEDILSFGNSQIPTEFRCCWCCLDWETLLSIIPSHAFFNRVDVRCKNQLYRIYVSHLTHRSKSRLKVIRDNLFLEDRAILQTRAKLLHWFIQQSFDYALL